MYYKFLKHISIISIFLSSLLNSLGSFAMHPECNNPEDDEVHLVCTNNHKGKWIKEITKLGEDIFCGGGSDWFEYIVPEAGSSYLGNNNNIFMQCTNETCSQSKVIGTDKFTVSQQGNLYSSNPRMFVLNIDDNYGQSCHWQIHRLIK